MTTSIDEEAIKPLVRRGSYFTEHDEHYGMLCCAKSLQFLINSITFILMTVVCAGSSWMTGENVQMGLWSVCVEDQCSSYTEQVMNSEERFSRITVVLSCMVSFTSVCLSIYGLCSSKSRGLFACISAMFASVGMLTTLVLFSIGENVTKFLPTEMMTKKLTYGSTFVLGWVSVSLSIFSSLCFFSMFYVSMKLKS